MAGPIRISILSNGTAARADIGKTSQSLGVLGKAGSKAGALLKKGLAAAGVGSVLAIGKFTKDAAVLDTKMREVVTLFGETGKAADRSLGQVSGQVKGLSNQFGLAQETLTGGLYQAISAGVPRENAFKFLQVASKAAIGGVTDVETSVDGLSSIINAFGLKATDAQSVADSLFVAVKGGKTNFEELSSSIFNVAPAAAAAGVSFQEVNAAIATLTAGGTPTTVATTQIRAALTGLQRPSAALDKIFQSLGYENAQLAVESKGLGFALTAVKKASKGNNGELQTLLGSTEAVAAANVIGGTSAKKYADEMKNQAKSAGAVTDAFETVNKGTERQFEILKQNLRNTGLSIGQALLPSITKLSKFLLDKAVPAIEGLVEKLQDNKDEFKAFGQTVTSTVLPPLKTLGEIAVKVGGFLKDLPDPVKSVGVQAGVAALIIPRLTGAVGSVAASFTLARAKASQFAAEMTYTATRTQAASAAMGRLAGASRGLAGVAGFLAVTNASKTSSKSLSTLGTVAGATAIGFALGGPWGAAAGAVVGVSKSIVDLIPVAGEGLTATERLASAQRDAANKATSYAESLDQVTGAITRQTRETALKAAQDAGIIGLSNRLKINTSDLIGSILGQEGATKRLTAAQSKNFTNLNGTEQAQFNTFLRNNTRDLALQQGEVQANALAVSGWGKKLRGLPPEVKTLVKQIGVDISQKRLTGLKRKYDLNPKQVQTIVKAIGVEQTVKKVDGVFKLMEGGKDVKPNLNPWASVFTNKVSQTKKSTKRGTDDILSLLDGAADGAKPNMAPFSGAITSGVERGREAASGASSIGVSLRTGVLGGVAGLALSLSGAVAGAVNAAILAGKRAARSNSPSKRMIKLGNDIGLGLVIGTNAKRKAAKKSGRNLVESLFSGAANGSSGATKAIAKIETQIERSFSKRFKNDREAAKRTRTALRGLSDESKALRRNGKAQDKNNARLRTARDNLRAAQQAAADYARTVKDGIVASGSVIGLGGNNDDQSVSVTSLIDQLQQKVENARRFSALIVQLTKDKLNQTSLQQIIDAGVDGGLATAEAIASGGTAAISQINTLTGQLTSVGGALGSSTANTMKAAGIAAAQGLVDGLESKAKALGKASRKLANAMVKAIKQALGIKSPSTVFKCLGTQSVKGLDIGLDETYVRRSGERLAGSLQKGFGNPALEAYAAAQSVRAGGGQPMTIYLTVNVPVGASPAETGRQIVKAIDAYRASGGRMAAL